MEEELPSALSDWNPVVLDRLVQRVSGLEPEKIRRLGGGHIGTPGAVALRYDAALLRLSQPVANLPQQADAFIQDLR